MNKSIPNGIKVGNVPSNDNQEHISNRTLPVYTRRENPTEEERSYNKHRKMFGGC